MGQLPNPKNYRKDEKMRKRDIKINVFINEEEQIRFKNKVKKLGLSQSSYIRKIITKDEIKNLNKYGLLKLDYLKKNNKVLYQRLIIEDKLYTFLFSVGKEAEEKLKLLINELAEKDKDLNENLKEENQLLWVQKMNNYKNIPRIF